MNGKKYDAVTGRLIDEASASALAPVRNPPKNLSSGVALDGFTRRPATPSQSQSPAPVPPSQTASQRSLNEKKRELQRSRTLMRPAVAKPSAKIKATAKTGEPVAHKRPELSVKDTRERERRASRIEKSSHVSRFSKGIFTPKISKRSEPLAVVADSPVAEAQQAAHSFPKSSATEQFERAMHAAASHLIKSPVDHAKRTKRRRLQYASFGVFAVLGLGFLAYQYIPNVKVQVAATRAGFSADLPDYSPAGFGLSGPVEAEAGKVSFKYASRTDNKAFKITQTPSNWTSQSLLNNFVVSSNKPYQTYQDQGKTVYIYDNSNATWVDGGVWYQLEGDASLTSDQLLRIANSL